jgi:WD40 repeat protein
MRHVILVVAVAALVPLPLRAQERLLLRERSPGAVTALRYSPDGSRLAACFQFDLSVRVYSADRPPVVIPRAHDGTQPPRFSPDGSAIVCGAAPNEVCVYDAATGAQRLVLTAPGEGGCFAVGPDGRTLAVGAYDGGLRTYDFTTLRERQTLQLGSRPISTLALSADGHTLATLHLPGVVRTRKDGKDWDGFDLSAGVRNQIWGLALSPDGKTLAAFNSGRTVLRDVAGRKTLGEFPGDHIAFTPDGRAVAGVDGDGLRVWSLDGRPLNTLPLPAGKTRAAQLLPAAGGRAVVVLFAGGEVVLYEMPDAARPEPRSAVLHKPGQLAPTALTPDGRAALIVDAEGRLHFFDSDAGSDSFGKELAADAPRAPPGGVRALAISADGRRAAVISLVDTARLWDVAARRETAELSLPAVTQLYHFSADGEVFMAVSPVGIQRWRIDTGKRLNEVHPQPALAASLLAWPAAGGSAADLAAAVAADGVLRRIDGGHQGTEPLTGLMSAGGDVLAVLSGNGLLRLIDLPTGKETELQRPRLAIHAIEFSPDGRLLAALRSDGSVETRDTATGRPTGETAPNPTLANARTLAFSPDGRRLLAYTYAAPVVIDLTTKKSMPLENANLAGIVRPRFSADGATVLGEAYGQPRGGQRWDAATGRLLSKAPAVPAKVLPAGAFAAAPDGKRVAAALPDGAVLIWDAARPGEPLNADRGATAVTVKELHFSPDGRLLAAACWNGEVRLWDTAGKLLKVMKHHTQRVVDIAFSPDGKLLAAESEQAGSLWEVDPSSATFGKLRAHLADLKAYLDPGLRIWSPDSKLLAVLTNDRQPRVIDAPTGAVRHTLPQHDANVLQMAFAADGRTLVARTASGRVYLWDGMTGKEVELPAALPATAETLAASTDGWIALATATRVVLWRGPGGKAPVELAAPKRSGAVAFSADGQAVGTGGAALRLWRLDGGAWKAVEISGQPDGAPLALLAVADGGRTALVQAVGRSEILLWDAVSGKGGRVAPAGPSGALPVARLVPGKSVVLMRGTAGSISLGNPIEGQMTRLYSAASQVTASATSADGRTTVTGSADGSLRWYAGDADDPPRYTTDGHTAWVHHLALSPDGKRLLSSAGVDQIALWDCAAEPKLLRSDTLKSAYTIEWSPDGTRVAVGSTFGEVQEWDAGGTKRRTAQAPALRPIAMWLSHDGRTLVVLDEANNAQVYDTTAPGALATLTGVAGAALSPDGKWLATVDLAGGVRLYEPRTGAEREALASLPAAQSNTVALAFSPDSRTLSVSCRDNTVRHWDLAEHKEGARFPACYSIIFSADSRRRIGVTTAGNITVWDAATGQEKAHWPGNGALSASADGQFVLVLTYPLGGKLYDVAGGEPVPVAKELGNQIFRALLTPDGKTAILASYTGEVHFWDRAKGADRAVIRHPASAVGLSPDGRWVVQAGGVGEMHFFDVVTARERVALSAPANAGGVAQFELSGDGSTLVASYYDGSVHVFDARPAPERPPLTGHTGPVNAVAVSAEGKRVATAGEDRTVRVFDPAAPARPFAVLRGSRTPVLGVAISPDGRTVAGTSADGKVYVWPSESREELLTLRGPAGWAVRVRYLPGGKRALSSGTGALRLWDLDKGTLIRTFAQGQQNDQMDLSPDGKYCISANGLVVREWDVETGKEVREFKGLANATVWVMLYVNGGKEVLAASGDGRILIWDREGGALRHTLEGRTLFPRCGAVSPDGKRLAIGDGHGNNHRLAITLWNLETHKMGRRLCDTTAEVCWVAWSSDGKRLLAACADATLRVLDPDTGNELKRIVQPTWVDTAAWLPDGKRVISTGNTGDNTVHLWDVESGKELRRFAGHEQPAITVAVAPDGRTALSCGKDGTLRQWSLAPRDPVVLSGHEGEVWSAAFSPDGKLLATAGADRTVRLWDVSGDRERKDYGKPVRTLSGAALGLMAVAFSPDGKRVAAGEGDPFTARHGAVRLWNVENGDLLTTLSGHAGAVRAVAFAPDGTRLASGGDTTVRLWDAREGRSLGVWHGHKTEVTGLAFDRDGKLLASAGAQLKAPAQPGEVLLWDVAAGRQRGPLVGHATGLTGVAIGPDGATLYGSAYDETVRVWSLAPGP